MRTEFCLVAALLASSCSAIREEEPAPAEQSICLQFAVEGDDSKSIYTDKDVSQIRNVTVYGVDQDGLWKRVSFGNNPKLARFRFPAGSRVHFYVMANMGEVFLPTDRENRILPELFQYYLPNDTDFTRSGIPMATEADVTLTAGDNLAIISLQRLVAKLSIRIDKSAITSGLDTPVLSSGSIVLCQANRRLLPFAREGSRATKADDLFSGFSPYFDLERFGKEKNEVEHTDIVLYVPENCQGVYRNLPANKAALCTYIEYRGTKDGSQDGVGGPMRYRAYLGGNVTDDYSVLRNRHYSASLSLTWDGLIWKADGWRIDASGLSDGRRLVIAPSADSFTAMSSDLQRVRKSAASAFYMNYSVDGGSTALHGRMLERNWPYGYEVLLDGKPLSSVSGTLPDAGLSWSYSATDDCLSLQALAGAPSDITHTLQMRSVDKSQCSNVVSFRAESPFTGSWAVLAPTHVAQQGVLRCMDPDTDAIAPEGIFHLTDPSMASKVRLTDNGDGTASVALIAPFTGGVSIYMDDSEGNRRSDPVVIDAALLPQFECTDFWTTYVDAPSSVRFTYYASNADGTKSTTPLTVRQSTDTGYTGVGTQLDADLVKTLLAPSCDSKDAKLRFTSRLMADGSYCIQAHIASYAGLSPTGKQFNVDDAHIGMSGLGSTRPMHTTTFTAWNPWTQNTSIASGVLMNDYTLYCEPEVLNDGVGWAANPLHGSYYVDDKVHTMDIGSVVVANENNLVLNACFATNEWLGNKVFSGSPTKVSQDYTASGYWLRLEVNRSVISKSNKGQLLRYLNGREFHFTDVEDMLSYLSMNQDSIIVGEFFGSASAAQSAASGISGRLGISYQVGANSQRKKWTLTYTMKGVKREDITTHGAGKLRVMVRIRNPWDGSYLERQVGEAFMRLHIFAWPIVDGPSPAVTNEGISSGSFSMGLYAPVEHYTAPLNRLLKGSGGRLYVAEPEKELWFNGANYTAPISYEHDVHIGTTEQKAIMATPYWYLPEDWAYLGQMDSQSAMRTFKELLGHGMQFPFKFKSEGKLNEIAKDCWYRADRYTLYYDPTGKEYEYSYNREGLNKDKDGKLFVIYLGDPSSSMAKFIYFPESYR